MPQDQKSVNKYNMMLDQLAGMYPEAEDEIIALQEKLADIASSDEDDEELMEEDMEMPEEDDESMPMSEMEDEEDMMA